MEPEKSLKSLHLAGINLAVACSYIVLGYMGTFLVIPPSIASSIWPPTGMALAVILVYGKCVIPGLFSGAFFLNIFYFSEFSSPQLIEPSLMVALFSSLGFCIQAIFGTFLIHRFLGKNNSLTEDSKIFRFFFLGAPVSCLTSSTISIVTIYLQGFIVAEAIPIGWATWWVGDCIGVILFTPIILAFIARPKNLWKIRQKLVAYPLLFMFIIVVTVFQYNQKLETDRIELLFERQVNKFHTLFKSKIIDHVHINQLLKGFFDSSQSISKIEFYNFTKPILKNHNFQALEWISYIRSEQRQDFENTHLIVREPDFENRMVSAANKLEYFPITYVQPLEHNQRVLGFDVSTSPIAFKAILIAIETGKTVITDPFQLVQDFEKKNGFVIYSPVYAKSKQINKSENKKNILKGFVASIFRISDEVEGGYIEFPDLELQLKIENQNKTLFSNFTETDSSALTLFSLKHSRQIKVANQNWSLTYQPSDSFYHNQITWTVWWLYLSGFVITSLIGIGLLILSGRTARTAELVRIRTQDLAKSEERWQFALEGNEEGVWDWNVVTDEVFFSTRYKELLGYQEGEIDNHLVEWSKRIHPDDKERVDDNIRKYFEHQTSQYENEHRVLCKDGTYKWILARGKVVSWTDGNNPLRMIGTHLDITDRKLAEEKRRLSSRVFSKTQEAIIITDTDNLIIEVNPAFSAITGYSPEDVLGKQPNMLHSEKQSAEFYTQMWQSINEHGHWQGEVWNRKKNGNLYAESLTISSIQDDNNHTTHYVGLFSDITKRKQQQQALELKAHYDELTQLPNRALFTDRFNQAIAHSKRTTTLLAVCFLDLDDFKPVNDNYGHNVGDQLLVKVAMRIKACIRDEDTVSRQGGDEFALLLGNINSSIECEQMLNRLHHSLAQSYIIDGHTINISASSGVTLYPSDNIDLDTLIRHADQAMYQAKLIGKNRYQLFNTEHDQQIINKHHQLSEIQQALFNDEFCLYYQPKVNMRTGKVFGAEALIRWLHPEKGLISPLKFLPIIKDTELEILIGNWVINEALKQLALWKAQDIELEVSVNISSYHLQSPSFVTDLEKALALHPEIDARFLQLEILESSALGDLQSISSISKNCVEILGVNIALDDFGTSYSSLTHLRNLPAKTIKIDQTFVRDMLDDPNDYAIIDGVIGLADSFNREVIAEGVETSEHGLMLLLMGCQKAQGYYISRPIPADNFSNWLSSYIPNEKWKTMGEKVFSLKEIKIQLLRLSLKRWQNKFENNIQSSAEDIDHWPILNKTKCHCGILINRAKQEQIFDQNWLKTMEESHNAMHNIADDLFNKYQKGEVNSARDGLKYIQVAYKKMYGILELEVNT